MSLNDSTRPHSDKVEYIESGEKITRQEAIQILLSISFGVGYLFLPLSFFGRIKQITGIYRTYQEVAYYLSKSKADIVGISILFLLFFGVNQLLGQFTIEFLNLIIKSVKGEDYIRDTNDELWEYTQYFLILAYALAALPLCRVLNYQRFKYLCYPILITICLVFICLVINLAFNLTKGDVQGDFCQIDYKQRDLMKLPTSEMGVAWANVVPSLCYAFGFQIYLLQVHKQLGRPDNNGIEGTKVGLITMLTIFLVYFLLFLITIFFFEKHNMENFVIYTYDLIFNSGLIFEFFTQIFAIIQLFCHLIFIFYITKEQAFILVDEIQRSSMSNMIDEFKKSREKDKEYTVTKNFDQDRNVTYIQYRLPHMTMPKKSMETTFWILYLVVLILALTQFQVFMNSVSFLGATCVPLSLYILPGYFYAKFHNGYSQRKFIAGVVFSILGVVIMALYSALVLYSQASIPLSKLKSNQM
ncbi:UNKNOWN [Stylonychia lemnae]|uniref:Amino acid transporter transmembrane domain-containing protein n=1 Tax=Stylonychia lemnae TaxID=5949 RepID=A0A077ZVM6_STYLE|nr:UNKNOWN [Stylonychia lemnae]|eukprot:CDW73924.1 UNKNOWN [Stylonychia lemnae]